MQYPAGAYAVAVLVSSPQGVPLVRDPKKPEPRYWKLPGGRSEEGETAKQCAVRELSEELGIVAAEHELYPIANEAREHHEFILFELNLTTLPELKKAGNEGEDIRVFSPHQILLLSDFFPAHRTLVAHALAGLT